VTAASAPGRVNLIGEHTDHSGGYVLPVAIPLRVAVEVTRRPERAIRASSAAFDDGRWQEVRPGERTGRWTDLIGGVAEALDVDIGLDVRIASEIPTGAGLGSSGALGVALVRALRDELGLALDDVEIAKLAHRAEHEGTGVRSGIMDQFAASLGREDEALFIDCRSLAFERIRMPQAFEIAVVDSGQRHRHASGAYNERRRECEEAARLLGVEQLRDIGPGELDRVLALPEPLARRARHVVTENARVVYAVVALRTADPAALGSLIDASHRSLRDDFDVSTPEVDLLVELAREQEGVQGARIHGGGFGGSIVALADEGAGHQAAARAVAEYQERTGLGARVLLPALAL